MKVFFIRFRRINYDRSSMMLLVTRTTPKEEVKRKSEGLTLFLADLPDDSVRGEAMAKHSINYSHAMQAPGGYGYAKEQHVERWWREMQLCRLAPVTNQMSLAYIGEHIMGMPKSFRTV